MATRANTSHPTGMTASSRHRSSSATNPSGVTSPFSPTNANSNHIDHSGQSLSPPSTSQSMPNTAARTNPLTATKLGPEASLDTSSSVSGRQFSHFQFYSLRFM